MTPWEVEARAAIHDLYGRWCHALDRGVSAVALHDFHPEGSLWTSDRGSYHGRAELEAIFAARAGATMHVISTVVVESVGEAEARSHAYFQLVDLPTGAVVAWGHYDDALVHDGEGWRWFTKAVDFDWRAEVYGQQVAALARADVGSPNPVGGLLAGQS